MGFPDLCFEGDLSSLRSNVNKEFKDLLRAPAEQAHESLAKCFNDSEFWNRLAESTLDYVPIEHSISNTTRVIGDLKHDGIARTDVVLDREHLTNVKRAVQTLHQKRWPKVSVILCDAFWELMQSKRLTNVLKSVLGEGYKMAARVWVTEVPAMPGAMGWRPHLDAKTPPRFDRDGLPLRMTTWCALSESTTDNGCIHILPRQVAGSFPKDIFQKSHFEANETLRLLQSARAMPCHEGEVLMWSKDIVHWGGRVARHNQKTRLSIATEFVSRKARSALSEPSFMAIDELPTFAQRQKLWARQILKYAEYEEEKHKLSPFVPFARHYL